MTVLKNIRNDENKADLRRACNIYSGQLQRCTKPRCSRYHRYGALGIRVEYTREEFVLWWLSNRPTVLTNRHAVGRKDHSKNYRLDNIEFQTASENSREKSKRLDNSWRSRPVLIIDAKTNEPLAIAESTTQAARYTGYRQTGVSKICRGIMKQSRCGLKFKFMDMGVT